MTKRCSSLTAWPSKLASHLAPRSPSAVAAVLALALAAPPSRSRASELAAVPHEGDATAVATDAPRPAPGPNESLLIFGATLFFTGWAPPVLSALVTPLVPFQGEVRAEHPSLLVWGLPFAGPFLAASAQPRTADRAYVLGAIQLAGGAVMAGSFLGAGGTLSGPHAESTELIVAGTSSLLLGWLFPYGFAAGMEAQQGHRGAKSSAEEWAAPFYGAGSHIGGESSAVAAGAELLQVGGTVAAIAGLVLRGAELKAEREAKRRVTVAPYLGPEGSGLVLAGSF